MVGLSLRLASRRRQRLAGAERGSRVSQCDLNPRCVRMRATQHAPRDPCHVLERRHGLAEIIERAAIVAVKRHRENPLHFEQTKDLTRLKTFLHTRKMRPPASIVRRWAPRNSSVNLGEPYIAVHFNLDCDWMLFRTGSRCAGTRPRNGSSTSS